jgi:hypothetical protein
VCVCLFVCVCVCVPYHPPRTIHPIPPPTPSQPGHHTAQLPQKCGTTKSHARARGHAGTHTHTRPRTASPPLRWWHILASLDSVRLRSSNAGLKRFSSNLSTAFQVSLRDFPCEFQNGLRTVFCDSIRNKFSLRLRRVPGRYSHRTASTLGRTGPGPLNRRSCLRVA